MLFIGGCCENIKPSEFELVRFVVVRVCLGQRRTPDGRIVCRGKAERRKGEDRGMGNMNRKKRREQSDVYEGNAANVRACAMLPAEQIRRYE
jgi:hypothetical protein